MALASLGQTAGAASVVAQGGGATGGVTVTGRIVSADTGEPVVGALVRLAGSDRTVLTDASGRYTIPRVSAGEHLLVVERIGFATERVGAIVPWSGTFRLDLAIAVRPVSLEGITIDGRSRCRVRPAEGLAVARVWEEARKALTATTLAEDGPYRYRTVKYARMIDPETGWVREEERRTRTGFFEEPFSSVPIERLVEHGFVERTDSATYYRAPDARVLLSDGFLKTHCLRLRASEGESGTVGLAFEPIPGRRLPEIDGVLWLDRETAALRRLEFEYRNLRPDVGAGRLGGEVEFERLPGGAWIVQRWSVRMPRIGRQRDVFFDGPDRRVLVAIKEEGGEVLEVRSARGRSVLSGRGAVLAGLVYDSTRAGPLAGATVFLSGTAYAAVTDEDGRFRMDALPAKSFVVSFFHPRLDSLRIVGPQYSVRLRPGETTRVRLSVPSPSTLAAHGCTAAVTAAHRDDRAGDSHPAAPPARGDDARDAGESTRPCR